jgi:hypothetical protein
MLLRIAVRRGGEVLLRHLNRGVYLIDGLDRMETYTRNRAASKPRGNAQIPRGFRSPPEKSQLTIKAPFDI